MVRIHSGVVFLKIEKKQNFFSRAPIFISNSGIYFNEESESEVEKMKKKVFGLESAFY